MSHFGAASKEVVEKSDTTMTTMMCPRDLCCIRAQFASILCDRKKYKEVGLDVFFP